MFRASMSRLKITCGPPFEVILLRRDFYLQRYFLFRLCSDAVHKHQTREASLLCITDLRLYFGFSYCESLVRN